MVTEKALGTVTPWSKGGVFGPRRRTRGSIPTLMATAGTIEVWSLTSASRKVSLAFADIIVVVVLVVGIIVHVIFNATRASDALTDSPPHVDS